MELLSLRENRVSTTTLTTVVFLAILALTISVARVALFRSDRNFVGQGYMYKELALALASGQGYAETHGPLRGQPTMRRPPLWPAVLALPMKACPQCNPVAVTQFATGLMQAATALGVALLVGMLSGSRRRMLLALLATAFLPEAQPLLLGGYCEPLASVILVIGILLLCCGPRFFFGGVVVLSLLPLVRPNFIPLWASVVVLVWWLQSHNRSQLVFGATKRRLIVAALLFYTPTALWILRNYFVLGAFPVMAGTSSMTFYGNYNPLSATIGPNFARWISPEKIPGYPQKRMSEAEEFRFYDSKGKDFIVHHLKVVPLLIGAHVMLSMLPSPIDGAHRYSFWVFRMLLYAAALIAIRRKSIPLESWFGVMLACSFLTTAVTVLMYSGEGRYLYPQNILLLVLVFSARYQKAALPDKPRPVLQVVHAASGAPQSASYRGKVELE
jgi:hypothetical protein